MKWGIFGGTFDPIHLGHLRCAEEIGASLSLEKVIFVPVFQPPHKGDASLTPFEHRERMVMLATAGNPRFSCSDVERTRGGKSYSVETVEHFLSLHPEGLEIFFILGQDAFRLIATWKDWERFLQLCNVVVMTRPGYEEEDLAQVLTSEVAGRYIFDATRQGYRSPTGHTILFRQVSRLDISSSHIRARIQAGDSVRYLVSDQVLSYIERHGCYRQ